MSTETKKLEIAYNNKVYSIEYFLRHGQKETVLYLHGLGCSKADFLDATAMGSLADYKLIAIDFPGHARSSYPEKLTMADLVKITHQIIKRLNLRNIILVGHSMGGVVALLYIDKYPQEIKAFINVEGNLAKEDCFFSRQIAGSEYDKFKTKMFRNFRQSLSKRNNAGAKKYAANLKEYANLKAFYDYSQSLVDNTDNKNLLNKFLSLKIPKLFVHGEENNALSYIPKLTEKGCEVSEISGSNHFPQYDNPSEFYQKISNFLDRV